MASTSFTASKTHYTPEELSTLSAAYETICDASHIRDSSPMVRELVASTVLKVADGGVRDPLRIVDTVMHRLGLGARHVA